MYFWSNHGIVCLIISELTFTQMQNILHKKKTWSDAVVKPVVEMSKMVIKKIGPLGNKLWIDTLHDIHGQSSCSEKDVG